MFCTRLSACLVKRLLFLVPHSLQYTLRRIKRLRCPRLMFVLLCGTLLVLSACRLLRSSRCLPRISGHGTVDCGFPGITRSTCVAVGCCFQKNLGNGNCVARSDDGVPRLNNEKVCVSSGRSVETNACGDMLTTPQQCQVCTNIFRNTLPDLTARRCVAAATLPTPRLLVSSPSASCVRSTSTPYLGRLSPSSCPVSNRKLTLQPPSGRCYRKSTLAGSCSWWTMAHPASLVQRQRAR